MTTPQPTNPSSEFFVIRVPDPVRGERFAQWLTAFGVSAIAKRIGVVRSTAQMWKSSGRYAYAPRLAQAWTIIELSHHYPHGIGPLTLEDIYGTLPRQSEGTR